MGASSFASLLRQHRLRLGLTQEELAERAQLSTRAISDLERRLKAPRLHTVRLLAMGLKLGADEAATLLAVVHDRSRGVDQAADQPAAHTSLPRQLSSFVGRQHELVEVERVLERTSLLTLVGPGGIGKTRFGLPPGAPRSTIRGGSAHPRNGC